MKLLYAEDEETMAEAVVDILTYHNYLVDTVADGARPWPMPRMGTMTVSSWM